MTQEDKELLLKDLCARLPYNVQIHGIFTDVDYSKDEDGVISEKEYDTYLDIETFDWFIHGAANIKPYLRPMESMTEEEMAELENLIQYNRSGDTMLVFVFVDDAFELIDFYNSHHFDYRGLIPMGLALPAKEGMYKED